MKVGASAKDLSRFTRATFLLHVRKIAITQRSIKYLVSDLFKVKEKMNWSNFSSINSLVCLLVFSGALELFRQFIYDFSSA